MTCGALRSVHRQAGRRSRSAARSCGDRGTARQDGGRGRLKLRPRAQEPFVIEHWLVAAIGHPADGRLQTPGVVGDVVLVERPEILFVGEQVHDGMANTIIAQMLFLESEDPEKDINFYINSPGGSVTAGLAIS